MSRYGCPDCGQILDPFPENPVCCVTCGWVGDLEEADLVAACPFQVNAKGGNVTVGLGDSDLQHLPPSRAEALADALLREAEAARHDETKHEPPLQH